MSRFTVATLRSLSPASESIRRDHHLIATATKPSRMWTTVRSFETSFAVAVRRLSQEIHQLPQKHRKHRFLLPCADHTNTAAKPHIGRHYDVATALITKVEDVNWREAAVRYAAKGGEVEEALEKLGSPDVAFDGAEVTLAEVRKQRGRLKRAAAKNRLPKATSPAHHPATSQAGTKRKRGGEEALKEEARLAKRARNAGEKRDIIKAEKHLANPLLYRPIDPQADFHLHAVPVRPPSPRSSDTTHPSISSSRLSNAYSYIQEVSALLQCSLV